MMNQSEFTLQTRDRALAVVFREATPEQVVLCRNLAAAEFGIPLSGEEYLEQEHYLGQQPLVRDNGWRLWCLSLASDPCEVLTTCKTIPRELLIRDISGTSRQKAYCIASVVTNSRYRGHGLASRLLEFVSGWLDEPGNAIASILYTSTGDFYERRGWKKLPAHQTTLSWQADSIPLINRAGLPETRPISSTEIQELCTRDVRDVETHLEKLLPGPNESHVCVLPTTNIITFLHSRSDFICTKVRGTPPRSHGIICEAAGSWLYWYHDFRKKRLAVQRVRLPVETSQIHLNALAATLLDAIEEARAWNLCEVILWDPSVDLRDAVEMLQERYNIGSETVARQNKSIPSFRWKHANESSKAIFHFNEFYAWS